MLGLDRHAAEDAIHCESCPSRSDSPWCRLPEATLARLDGARRARVYDSGDTLFRAGEACAGIMCIESGAVVLRREAPQGSDVVTRVCHPGETLGSADSFGEHRHAETARALTDCRVCFVSRESLGELMRHDPNVAQGFLERLARDLEAAEERALFCQTLPVRARIAGVLLTLKDRFAEVDEQGDLILTLPLTRTEIASWIGARPETLSRAIRELERDGVARFQGRSVTVHDLDALLDEIELAGRQH